MLETRALTWEQAVHWLRTNPSTTEMAKACFYDDPLLEAARRYANSSEWRAISALLPSSKGDALDLGAGRGIASFALAREGWRVVAAEPDESTYVGVGAIRSLAEEAGLELSIVQSFGESLPFDNGSFDLVHCRAVLHHASDLALMCREVSRVLRRGGRVIATREHVISRPADLGTFLAAHPLHHLYGGENAYGKKVYIEALRNAGLKIERVLNSFESDINLYPDSAMSIRERLAARIGSALACRLPSWLFKLRGDFDSRPGRLYSFVARKM